MFAVDGGDDGDDGRVIKKAAIAFVGFDDEIFAFTEASGGSGLVEFAANDERRIKMRGSENARDHGGRGCFAVCAGDGDAVFEAHQFGEHFRARNDGDFAPVRFDNFRIVGLNRGRNDDDVRIFDVRSFVAFVNRGAEILKALGCGGRLCVRAGNVIAECEQNFSNAAHADAADSDEMNALKIPESNHHDARPLSCRPAACSIRSTMSRAALGFPKLRALLESCSSSRGCPGWAGESMSENISEARRSAVNSFYYFNGLKKKSSSRQ